MCVCAAAGTTLGSCAFLFFCTIRLFVQFDIVVFANTAHSVLFGLLFLAALLATAGPEQMSTSLSLGAVVICCKQWCRVWWTTHPQPHRDPQDGHQGDDEEGGLKRSAVCGVGVGVAPHVLGKRAASECDSGGGGEDDIGGPTRAVSESLAEERMDRDGDGSDD